MIRLKTGTRRRSLWLKYAWALGGLLAAVTLAAGIWEGWSTYRQALEQAQVSQQRVAQEVAYALAQTLSVVERQLTAVAKLPWDQSEWFTPDQRRQEFHRLLLLVPSVTSLEHFNSGGQSSLLVSRLKPDSVSAPTDQALPLQGKPASPQATVHYGDVFYVQGYEPQLQLTVRLSDGSTSSAGHTVATLGLRTLARELRQVLQAPGLDIAVVDAQRRVVLHAEPAVMLAQAQRPDAQPGEAVPGLLGQVVLSASAPVAALDWSVVVDRPRADVLLPVLQSLWRTGLITLLGACGATAVALVLSNRLTQPIRQLHEAAARLEDGKLGTRITLHTHDELEDLAHQFNRMAASLQANVAELEDKVAARTLELQRASQAKSDFLAQMSHELRTPLNAILGFADVLREGMAGSINDEQREYIADIHASGLHLLSLINDVLDLSRIEAGQLQLEWADFDVGETAESALALVRQSCMQKGLHLQLHQQPETQVWRGDARRVKQMLVNLLANAVKFTPTGGRIDLRIFLKPGIGLDEATQAPALCLQVQDTGSGIAPEDHETVFKDFVQVGDNTEGRAAGSGLGLPLVRRLARAHGGEVTLASALGAGATFTVTLPKHTAMQV